LCHARVGHANGSSLVLGVPDANTPFIRDELHSVAARLRDAELYFGDEATVEVLRAKSDGRRVVHIAAHGFFRPDNPMFSGIRLGASTYLTLYDLYNLKLPAELVVLSACVTGVNVIAVGDELLGLARGLFRAGAASLLLTLWEVPDESTAEFMKGFYDRILTAPNRAAALRDAMLESRERYPHPIHWAPFVLMGKAFGGSPPGQIFRTGLYQRPLAGSLYRCPPSGGAGRRLVMADTDGKTRKGEHFTEEDWFDFAHRQAAPSLRASLEQHLEKGCSRCTQTVRLWEVVLDVADQEAAYRPPDEVLRQLRG